MSAICFLAKPRRKHQFPGEVYAIPDNLHIGIIATIEPLPATT